jgi:hypothetical protein
MADKSKQPNNRKQLSMYADIRNAWRREIRRLKMLEEALVRANVGAP